MDEYRMINSINWRIRQGGEKHILWLHGYTMNNQIWDNIWRLLPNYSHMAPDLPGHGKSISITQIANLSEITSRIFSGVQSLKNCSIFGLSFGGMIALQIALDYPDHFEKLILNSSPIGGLDVDIDAQSKNIELIRLYNSKGAQDWLSHSWTTSPPIIFDGIKRFPNTWNQVFEEIKKHSWEELKSNHFSTIIGHSQMSELQQIKYPILYLLGEDDMDNIKRCANIIYQKTPDAMRIYLPDTGHLGVLENPEMVSNLITSFLT